MARRRRAKAPQRADTPYDPFSRCRAYVGQAVPTSVSNALRDVQRRLERRLEGDESGLRWVSPLSFHVNLRHLGEILPETLEHVKTTLDELAQQHTSFPVRAAELVFWPPEEPPSALWITLDCESGELTELRAAIDAAVDDLALAAPEHPFEPHVTLALIDGLPEAEDFLQQARAFRGQGLGRFWLSELQLFAQPIDEEGPALFEEVARSHMRRPLPGGARSRRSAPAEDGPQGRPPPGDDSDASDPPDAGRQGAGRAQQD